MDVAESVDGLLKLARARAKAGDLTGAARTWEAAIHLAEQAGIAGPEVAARLAVSEKLVQSGKPAEALDQLLAAWGRVAEGPPSAQRAEVEGRLGQVMVFVGEVAAGVARMRAASAAWTTLGEPARSTELDLATQAVEARVDRAVSGAKDAEARVRALRVRATMLVANGSEALALRDLRDAWATVDPLPAGLRTVVGLDLAALLVRGSEMDAARAVLGQARGLTDDPNLNGAVDELLVRVAQADACPTA